MNSPSHDLRRALPLFDGFPYLNTHVAPALCHIILLPAGLSETHLGDAVQWQVLANRLPVCLVLARDRAIYWEPEGRRCATQEPPVGGNIIADSLAPVIVCDDSIKGFRTRQNRLDPSAHFAGQVMTVHCYCDNHNRCARCHEPLYKRRLNANYYDPADGGIWHVPGFCGLSHRCSTEALSHRSAS